MRPDIDLSTSVWAATADMPAAPPLEGKQFEWSGQVMEPMDGLAFIGRNPNDESNVYIATGATAGTG